MRSWKCSYQEWYDWSRPRAALAPAAPLPNGHTRNGPGAPAAPLPPKLRGHSHHLAVLARGGYGSHGGVASKGFASSTLMPATAVTKEIGLGSHDCGTMASKKAGCIGMARDDGGRQTTDASHRGRQYIKLDQASCA